MFHLVAGTYDKGGLIDDGERNTFRCIAFNYFKMKNKTSGQLPKVSWSSRNITGLHAARGILVPII